MPHLKRIYQVIRIECFVVWLCGIFMSMDAWDLKLISLTGFLILAGSLLVYWRLDAQMIRARPEITRVQGLQIVGILILLGLFLLYSPLDMLQMTKLDPFNVASLILGIIILLINLILFAALWVMPHKKSVG